MKIQVSQEDIDSSFEYFLNHKNDPDFNWQCNCPLAFALNRQTNKKWKVGCGIFKPANAGYWKETPKSVDEFVDVVDKEFFHDGEKENIEPESFILNIEQFDEPGGDEPKES